MSTVTSDRTTSTPSETAAPPTGLATVGMLLVAAALLANLVAGILDGLTEDLVFFGGGLAVALVGAAVSRRRRRWAGITILVLTLLLLAAFFWLVFGLAFPASPVEFPAAIAYLLGVVLSLWGAVRLVRRRHSAPRAYQLVVRGAIVLVALGVVASGVIAATGGQSVSEAEAASAAMTATMAAFEFEEGTYEVDADQATTLLLRNEDAFVHDFTVPGLDVASTLAPGDEVLLEVTAPAGTYTVYCTLHSDVSVSDPVEAGMAAELVSR